MLKNSLHRTLAQAKHSAGVTLIESLVSIVVLALGVLGLLGTQLRTMVDSRSASSATVAARLADELFERVKVNPNANITTNPTFVATDPLNVAQWGWLAGYTATWGTVPAIVTNCDNAFCNTADKAAWDMNRWTQSVAAALPGGQARVQISPDNARQLIVIIGWGANEGNGIQTPLVMPANVAAPAQCATTHSCYVAYGQP